MFSNLVHQESDVEKIRIVPTVWDLPDQGVQWCDCGQDHALTLDFVIDVAEDLGHDDEVFLTHQEVVELTMEVWGFAEVCRFFHLALNAAAECVNGAVEEEYRTFVAFDIVGYFSKTWQGCPAQACEGGYSSSDIPDPGAL